MTNHGKYRGNQLGIRQVDGISQEFLMDEEIDKDKMPDAGEGEAN